MAKINWTKHNYKKQQDDSYKSMPVGGDEYHFYKDNNLWTLTGKHYGTHIHKLPLHYLNWIVDNFESGKYKQQAVDELYRRHAELTH